MGREQSRIGIIIRLIQWSHILLVFISPTWLELFGELVRVFRRAYIYVWISVAARESGYVWDVSMGQRNYLG